MAEFKDHFSTGSTHYRQFRPGYPDELFSYLAQRSTGNQLAWDCATGSGQAAVALARHYDKVIASDASTQQITHATTGANVEYRVMPAEQTDLADASVDLITVAQALHWFDHDAFFNEVSRVIKPGGILAIWSYQLLNVQQDIDNIINQLYFDTLKNYWPPEREQVESGYADITFPWPRQSTPEFNMRADWTLQQMIGYLGTWSATRAYRQDRQHDPLIELYDRLLPLWGDARQTKSVRWPLRLHLFQPR